MKGPQPIVLWKPWAVASRGGVHERRNPDASLSQLPSGYTFSEPDLPTKLGLDTSPEAETRILEALDSLDRTRDALQAALETVRQERGESSLVVSPAVGPLVVDISACRVTLHGTRVPLSPTEFQVLALLATHIGEVVSYDAFASEVWHDEHGLTTPEMVRTYIWRIRQRLEHEPSHPKFIIVAPRIGYRLRNQVQWQAAAQEAGTLGINSTETEP